MIKLLSAGSGGVGFALTMLHPNSHASTFFSPEYMESYPLSALTLRDIGAISYEYITLITSKVSCHYFAAEVLA